MAEQTAGLDLLVKIGRQFLGSDHVHVATGGEEIHHRPLHRNNDDLETVFRIAQRENGRNDEMWQLLVVPGQKSFRKLQTTGITNNLHAAHDINSNLQDSWATDEADSIFLFNSRLAMIGISGHAMEEEIGESIQNNGPTWKLRRATLAELFLADEAGWKTGYFYPLPIGYGHLTPHVCGLTSCCVWRAERYAKNQSNGFLFDTQRHNASNPRTGTFLAINI
ncbi:MAG: hypothetical protein AAB468_00935 [Patescibacteria group bacterium]